MNIKFANTDGVIFDYELSSLGRTCALGELIPLDDDIIIVDRYPMQETTQIEITKTIEVLRYILQKNYTLQTGDIKIYLPRMDANISKQAKIQEYFDKLSVKNAKPIPYFNITLVHL